VREPTASMGDIQTSERGCLSYQLKKRQYSKVRHGRRDDGRTA